MPTIRDLVSAIRQRDGVDAVVVLGRDGLLIDHQAAEGLDAESIAALVPAILVHADQFGGAASRGHLLTAVHEFERGSAVVAAMSPEAVLLVLLQPTADLGALLFDLRRHRANIAALA